MKKAIKTVLALMAGGLALSACNDEIVENEKGRATGEMTFTATVGNDERETTRASISDGTSIVWNAEDCISIFSVLDQGTIENRPFSLSSGAGTTQGSFQGQGQISDLGYWALYPYHTETTFDASNSSLRYKWNGANQEAVANSFPKNTPMLAYADAPSDGTSAVLLPFKNICAFLKFTIDYKCKSVTIKAKNETNLASEDILLSKNSDGAYKMEITDVSPSKTITLTGANGGILESGTYYIAMAPRTLQGGFDLTFEGANNTATYTKSTTKNLTLERSHVVNLDTINLRGTDLETLEGSGTAEEPYLIKDFDDLYTMQKWVANNKGLSSYYRQTADIVATGKKINPIGNRYRLFSGTYDGGGHAIKELVYWETVSYDYVQDDQDSRSNTFASALFGAIKNATICNLTVIDPVFDKDNYKVNLTMSPLVGVAYGSQGNWCKITNCKVQGSSSFVEKSNRQANDSPLLCYVYGGFVGDSQCNLEITECEYALNFNIEIDCEKKAHNYIGGFVGLAQGINEDSSSRLEDDGFVLIKHCRTQKVELNMSDIGNGNSEMTAAGGFIGKALDYDYDNDVVFNIVNCVNNMSIQCGVMGSYRYHTEVHIGGFVGRNECEGYDTKQPGCLNCLNNGAITTYHCYELYQGGLIGSSIVGKKYSTVLFYCVNAKSLCSFDIPTGHNHFGGITARNASLVECWATYTSELYEYYDLTDNTYWGSQTESGYKHIKEVVSHMNEAIQKSGLQESLSEWVNRGTESKPVLDLNF